MRIVLMAGERMRVHRLIIGTDMKLFHSICYAIFVAYSEPPSMELTVKQKKKKTARVFYHCCYGTKQK